VDLGLESKQDTWESNAKVGVLDSDGGSGEKESYDLALLKVTEVLSRAGTAGINREILKIYGNGGVDTNPSEEV